MSHVLDLWLKWGFAVGITLYCGAPCTATVSVQTSACVDRRWSHDRPRPAR